MDPAQLDPYVTPPQYREAGPSDDGNGAARLLSYPPLQAVDRRRSGNNTDFGTRRAFAANLQMVEPYSNEVHRPNYTQRSVSFPSFLSQLWTDVTTSQNIHKLVVPDQVCILHASRLSNADLTVANAATCQYKSRS